MATTTAEHKVILNADASRLISSTNKATKATEGLGKAQKLLKDITRQAAAAENPFLTVRQKHVDQLNRLKQLYRENQITLAQYQAGVNSLKASLVSATKNQQQMTQAMMFGRTMTRQSRAAFGQLGYQIQDIAVQLQMGQNAMLVFAQQGSQIASLLGPGGAVIGAILAVGGALAMAFLPSMMEAKKSVEDLASELEALEEKMPSGIANILGADVAQIQLEAATDGIGELLEKRKEALEKFKGAQLDLSYALAPDITGDATGEFTAYTKSVETAKEAVSEARNELLEANLAFHKNQVAINKAQEALDLYVRANEAGISVKAVKSADDLTKSLKKQVDTWGMSTLSQLKYRIETEAMTNAQRDQLRELFNHLQTLELNKQAFEDASKAAEKYGLTLEQVKQGGMKTLEDGLMSILTGAKNVADAFKDMGRVILQSLLRMQIQQSIINPLASGLGIPMGKAIGGPVSANTPYMVGEKGPELFIPNGSGKIVKNSDMQGGSQIVEPLTVNFNLNAVDTQSGTQFLVANKGAIVGMIQQAYNRRGMRGPNG